MALKMLLFASLWLSGTLTEVSAQPQICNKQSDLVFVVDSSGSINDQGQGNWDTMINFIVDVVNNLDVGIQKTRIGFVKFANGGHVIFTLDRYATKKNITDAIKRVRYSGGNTNTQAGLRAMREGVFNATGDRRNVPDVGIVITDGYSTKHANETARQARLARRSGINMFAVGITNQINMTELKGIAGDFGRVFRVADFNKLKDIVSRIVTETCVTPTTTTTLPTTAAMPPPNPCNTQIDLVLALDGSGSIGGNFNKMLSFVEDLITYLEIDNGKVRVGLLTFSNGARLWFHLNQFKTRKEMVQRVRQVTYPGGTTNTAAALRYVHNVMFSSRYDERSSVKNVVVVITDGESNNVNETFKEAMALKKKGIVSISIGVDNWLNEYELEAIASYPYESHRLRLRNFNGFTKSFRERLRMIICNNANGCLSNPCRYGATCNNLLAGYWCGPCPTGRGGTNCDGTCRKPADVVFALDASGSVNPFNFKRIVDFVRKVIQTMNIGSRRRSQRSRVGVLTFADRANIIFHLNEHDTKGDILNGLVVHYTRGSTNTGEALRAMRVDMFRQDRGDQPNVQNVGIIITDGRSDNERRSWKEAYEARKKGIHIIVVAVGNGNLKKRELDSIASYPPSSNIIRVDRFSNLNGYQNRLRDAICNNRDDCGPRPCMNGGRCRDLINSYECVCSSKSTGPRCDRRCSGVADIIFLLDASGSIHRERFPLLLSFVQNIVQLIEVSPTKARVGVAKWSDSASVEFHLNSYTNKHDVMRAVQYITYLGQRTKTADAIRIMRTQMFKPNRGDRSNVPNFAFIITDGNSNINQLQTIPEAVQARVEGIHIMVVSVGKYLNKFELRAMASEPKTQNIFQVETFRGLPSMVQRLPKAICDDVNECSRNPCRNGGRCINGLRQYTCICPEGRVGLNCERTCRRQLDVTFILDLSGSVQAQHERILSFTKRVIYGLDMSYDRTRVSVITFGDRATVQFYLNKYRVQQDVINALDFNPNKGRTNIQDAIRVTRQQIFTSGRGDRSGVRNIAVLLTDGYSNVASYNTIPEADRAKRSNIEMYVVAVGQMVNRQSVNDIASDPVSQYVINVPRISEINSRADELSRRLCQ